MLLDLFERNGRGRTFGNATLMVNRASLLYNLGEIKASQTAAQSARERVEGVVGSRRCSIRLGPGPTRWYGSEKTPKRLTFCEVPLPGSKLMTPR